MQNKLIIPQRLTFSEFLLTNYIFFLYSKRVWKLFFILLGVLVIGHILKSIRRANRYHQPYHLTDAWPLLIVTVGIVLVGLLAVCFISWVVYRKSPWLFNNVSFEITESGIVRKAGSGSLQFEWADVTRCVETKRMFVLLTREDSYHILQKRMFGSEQDVMRFRELLEKIK